MDRALRMKRAGTSLSLTRVSSDGQSNPSAAYGPMATASSDGAPGWGLGQAKDAARSFAPMPPLRATRTWLKCGLRCPLIVGRVVSARGRSCGEDDAKLGTALRPIPHVNGAAVRLH